MARGRKTSLSVQLTPAERRTLLAWQRATTISAGRARRGRTILLVANGVPITAIAAMIGISRRFVYKWTALSGAGRRGIGGQTWPWARAAPGSPAGAARHGAALGSLETARVASKAQT